MEVRINAEAGTVYVGLREAAQDVTTNMWRKFGVFPHWDGHGGLIGIEFTDIHDVTVKETSGQEA